MNVGLTLLTLCYFIFEFWYCYFYWTISALLLSCMYTIYHVYGVKPYLISIIYNFYYCKTKIESNICTFTQILHDSATFRCLNIYIFSAVLSSTKQEIWCLYISLYLPTNKISSYPADKVFPYAIYGRMWSSYNISSLHKEHFYGHIVSTFN